MRGYENLYYLNYYLSELKYAFAHPCNFNASKTKVISLVSFVWLGLGVLVLILIGYQTAKHYKHYVAKRSPLIICYALCFIATLSFEGFQILVLTNIKNSNQRTTATFLALCSVFSAYLIVLYSWVVVFLKLRAVYEQWRKACMNILIGLNVVVFVLVIGLVLAGNTFVASFCMLVATTILDVAYLIATITTCRVAKSSISQKAKLSKMTKMANGTCIITFAEVASFAGFLDVNARTPDSIIVGITYELIQLLVLVLTVFLVFNLRGFATLTPPPKVPPLSFTASQDSQTPRLTPSNSESSTELKAIVSGSV